MKEFYGSIHLTAEINFSEVQAEGMEEAKKKVLEEIIGLQVVTEENSSISIDEINWNLHSEGVEHGLYIPSMDITEEINNWDLEMDCLVCNLGKERACADCCRDWDNEEEK